MHQGAGATRVQMLLPVNQLAQGPVLQGQMPLQVKGVTVQQQVVQRQRSNSSSSSMQETQMPSQAPWPCRSLLVSL
jgi:hypothetical protein